jgi:hypothetical protein
LPIVLRYGGSRELDPPTPGDENNIIAALRQTDRVVSISLTISRSLLEKLHAIERPFPELEDLVLLSQDDELLTLPNAFRWGSRLRCLRLTGIVFPPLLQLLHSSRNLVDLHLHRVLDYRHFSPKVLTNLLSGMTQLRSLSLHILSTTHAPSAPPAKRVILPALIHLGFRGNTEYLAGLVTRIDAPRLGHIDVAFSTVKTSELSVLGEFIDRIGIHRSHRRADIVSSDSAISISLIRTGTPEYLQLQLSCPSLDLQLSSIARICVQFSAFLFDVEDLRICVTRQSRREAGLNSEQWLEPINFFKGVKWLHVAGNLSAQIVRALQQPENAALSALQGLYILQPGPRHAPLREAVVSFMTLRRLFGHPIEVEYERLSRNNELRETGKLYAPCLHHNLLTHSE